MLDLALTPTPKTLFICLPRPAGSAFPALGYSENNCGAKRRSVLSFPLENIRSPSRRRDAKSEAKSAGVLKRPIPPRSWESGYLRMMGPACKDGIGFNTGLGVVNEELVALLLRFLGLGVVR